MMKIRKYRVRGVLSISAAFALAGALGGCDNSKPGANDPANKPKPPQPVSPTPVQPSAPNNAAVPGHDHDHDHGKGDDAKKHGDALALGPIDIGSTRLEVTQYGKVEAGKEVHMDLKVVAQGESKVAAIRLWVGVKNGDGSEKAKAELEADGHGHVHVDAPSPMPADAKLWIEIENAKGERTLGYTAFK